MKAVRLAQSLELADVPQPSPGRGEILVRVYAAGVIAAELSWYPTTHDKSGGERKLAVPCHEFSGVVAAAGEDAGTWTLDQEIFGMSDWFSDGALAEYCVAPHAAVVRKHPGLTHAQAASLPISGLTAWQGLFDRAKLRDGETVLVHGGAGAVGAFAVQLARCHGCRVIATASAQDRDYVTDLGAGRAIDYKAERFEETVRDVDVVFDTVGGETLEKSWQVLRPGGRLVTVASTTEQSSDPRVKQAFFIVEPNQRQLVEIGTLVADGKIRTAVAEVVPLAQSPQVFEPGTARRGRGKTVVEISK